MYRTGNIPPLLADLVDMDSPAAVLDEVLFIMTLITPQMDPTRLTNAFNFAAGLYGGRWPGERECNTGFHDFRHITDTFLAMARLIHGAILNGHMLNEKQIYAGLVSAILHDAGYIQDADDGDGTGAKYTTVHVQRSMDFVQRYGQRYGLTQSEIPDCRQMILCTDLGIDIASLSFSSPRVELLGKLLGCADLIGQMADRIYLEKLFYLYREFEEGKVLDYADEMDLLAKTLSFFPAIDRRINEQLGGVHQLAKAHFAARWNISRNLYQETIEKQRRYLEFILSHPHCDPKKFLRRKNIVAQLIKRATA
jgi:hypothetical protein